jgi:hypothetical protein
VVLVFVGIDFLSLLTASIASRFFKEEQGAEHAELMEPRQRIEADIAELKLERDVLHRSCALARGGLAAHFADLAPLITLAERCCRGRR